MSLNVVERAKALCDAYYSPGHWDRCDSSVCRDSWIRRATEDSRTTSPADYDGCHEFGCDMPPSVIVEIDDRPPGAFCESHACDALNRVISTSYRSRPRLAPPARHIRVETLPPV